MCVWYKQVLNDRTDGIQNCTLTDGPMDLRIVIADKCLIVETDRPKVLFLERQCKSQQSSGGMGTPTYRRKLYSPVTMVAVIIVTSTTQA